MIDLTKCTVERLRADDTFILYRAYRTGKAPSLLALVPRQPTISSLEKLKNEYALATDLDPSCAVLPIELVPHKESMMLVLEDPGGRLLASLIEKPIELDERLRLAFELAGTVGRLHRHELLHRDIKPGNVLVTDGGIRLTGFGNAIHQARHGMDADVIAGTLAYLAPEQSGRMNRPIDARSDLYSLGVTLYELFTGTLPFSGSTPEQWIHSHVVRAPPSPRERMPDLPEQVSEIVLKLLSKEPADRYQSAEGLAADLEECLAEWKAYRPVQHFALGRHDAVSAVRIPRTLYGRAPESAALRAAFDRVAEKGQTTVVLISGASGVGKSSLVTEFQFALAPERALMAAGKFDVQMRDVPYAALTQAFGSLLRQILTYDDEKEVDAWRRTLAEAAGPNGRLVTELIPAFELVLGRQPPLADLTPQDRLNRLRIVFRRLVGAFARPGRPLVLFVDDLQWLDPATLDLVADLITRRDVPNLMLIGAYRADEVGPVHPLMLQLEAVRSGGVPVVEVVLQPLTLLDITVLIAETLKCGRARARPLANLIHAKTGGNPFFATQFIQALNDEGLLAYDPHAGTWCWDIDRVRAKGFTNNVADLVAEKLNLLPENTRQVLRDLASLGSSTEIEVLAVASGHAEQEVTASLRPAAQAGLVARSGRSYAFVHDRVQEAAYGLRPDEDKPALHLRIGMALAEHTTPNETSEKLYVIANQLNRGLTAVATKPERDRIIAVNLAAGQRARTAAAYNAAIAYLKVAQELLGNEAHPRCSPTAFAVALLRAECEFLVGHLDVGEAQLLALSQSCPNVQASAQVTRLQANLYTTRGQLERAVAVCLEFLRQVGIDWRPHPTDSEVDEEGHRLRTLAEALSDEQLRALPPMDDPSHRATMEVFADLITPALLTDLKLSHIVILAAARLTLRHGIWEGSCYPLACVFPVLNIRYADAELGFRIAQFGVSLANRWPQLRLSGRTFMTFGQYVIPWVEPIRSALPFLSRALEIALATGDLTWVGYSYHALLSVRHFSGEPLEDICKDAEQGVAFAEALGFGIAALHLAVSRNLALSLTGRSKDNSFELTDPTEPRLPGNVSLQSACFEAIGQIQVHVLAGRHAAALALAKPGDTLFRNVRAYLESMEYRFYVALAHAAAYDASPPEHRAVHVEGLRHHHHELAIRCARNPASFADRSALLAAEIARIEGRALEAEQLYEEAIRLAREASFVQIEAIAAECAARFYEARGIRTVVLSYLANARDCYQRWGAYAKVRQLERSNPHLPASDLVRASPAAFGMPLHQLDINALFRASRALSGEIEIDALIRTLMKVVIEHAAAERGILFLIGNDTPQAVAEAHLGTEGIDVIVREAGCPDIEFSHSVLNFVVRTRTSLSSNEPENKKLLSADPYLRQRHVSLHCLPIVTQAKLVGVLYLETQAAVAAFTPQRTAVLNLLAAQAAISIENARLYAHLQRSEAFLADGQSISHTGSWSWDAHTRKLVWSNEHYRIFGMDPDNGKAPTVARAFRMVHPDDRRALRRAVESAIGNHAEFTCDYRLIRSDEVRHLQVVGRPATKCSRERGCYVGTTIDLSDYRRAQEALQAAQSDLSHASRLAAIGELTSLIAHEVRQPLTAIAARAGACRAWLSRAPADLGKAAASVAQIEGYALHASGVMESIRQMTRKSAPTRTPLDINDAIRETATLLGSEISRQRVVLKLDLAAGLDPVLGDRVQLQQVIMNLMMNGIEAMAAVDDRPRLLRLSTRKAPSETETVAVAVADVGVGLAADKLERLFEAFFTTKPNGLGVGLTICRSIVEAHGGRLWVSANLPRGAVFQFTVPA